MREHIVANNELAFVDRRKRVVMEAIASSGFRVTPALIATNTGYALSDVTTTLNRIAAETGAELQVSRSGELFYCFSSNFVQSYVLTGLKRDVHNLLSFAGRGAFFLARISFGVILIMSILVGLLLLIVALCALADNGGGGSGGDWNFGSGGSCGGNARSSNSVGATGGGGSKEVLSEKSSGKKESSDGFFDLQTLSDVFDWNYTPSHREGLQRYQKGNFFLECFSFLFGDGDPNALAEEQKWKLIVDTIKANQGVVTAEQLSPFTGIDSSNDRGVFEVLFRFDGRPFVTETGNILYVFEKFQSFNREDSSKQPETKINRAWTKYHKEERWKFSEYSVVPIVNVTLLATANLVLSWWLFKHIATIAALHPYALLIDFLLGYGVLFLVVPLVRTFFNMAMNEGIAKRNRKRRQFAQALEKPSGSLKLKLAEAQTLIRSIAVSETSSEIDEEVVYSSAHDLLEQQLQEA